MNRSLFHKPFGIISHFAGRGSIAASPSWPQGYLDVAAATSINGMDGPIWISISEFESLGATNILMFGHQAFTQLRIFFTASTMIGGVIACRTLLSVCWAGGISVPGRCWKSVEWTSVASSSGRPLE